jgi:hypothetical protein
VEGRKEGSESFSNYVHQKIILGNRVPVMEEKLVEYIINGISDHALRNQARVGCFGTRASLMTLFEQVELWDKEEGTKSNEGFQSRPRKDRGGEGTSRGRGSAIYPIISVKTV